MPKFSLSFFKLFLLSFASTTAQTTITDTGFKLITDSPIILLDASAYDKISFFSNCVHCQYGNLDFSYFQMDLLKSELSKTYRDNYKYMQRGDLPVSKYPAKTNSYFDVKKYKEVELNINGSIDTYDMIESYQDYRHKPYRTSGERFVYLGISKYYGSISLFTGSQKDSRPIKTDFSFFSKEGFYWISDFYSCSLNNKSFVSIKKSNRISELAEVDDIYVVNNDTNKIEQKITVNNKDSDNIFYPLADTGEFVVLNYILRGSSDKNNKNYGITMNYFSANTANAKGKYIKVWETKLSLDFTAIGAISVANGQIIVGGTSRNGGYLGFENPYLNIFDIKTGKFKKDYYIPLKTENGQTVYNIIPLKTSTGISPTGNAVKGGLYGGTNGDLLICCQPYKTSFKESGLGKGMLIRDYLNADGTFYNNLFNDETWKKNTEKKIVSNNTSQPTGKEVLPRVPSQYDLLDIVYDGKPDTWYVIDKKTNKYGMVNKQGTIILPAEYSQQFDYHVNSYTKKVYAIGVKDDKYGILDINNNIIMDFKYDDVNISSTIGDVCLKDENGKWGLIDTNLETKENLLIDFKYDRLKPIYKGKKCDGIIALKDGFWGFLDIYENVILDFKYVSSDSIFDDIRKL